MQGTVFDIKRFAVHDGPGIRTTVFLKGCPLRCLWCHNPEGIRAEVCRAEKKTRIGERVFEELEPVGRLMPVGELMDELRKEVVFMEESGGGVTFSGGEPLMQPLFLAEALARCRREGMHTAVDTSGFAPPDTLQSVAPLTNLFLYDLKLIDEREHVHYTGVSNRPVLENLRMLSAGGGRARIRLPMIPGVTCTAGNIDGILDFLAGLAACPEGVDLLPFHNTAVHKYARFGMDNPFADAAPPARDELEAVKERFESAGYEVKIGG